jgi:hypothetical protein
MSSISDIEILHPFAAVDGRGYCFRTMSRSSRLFGLARGTAAPACRSIAIMASLAVARTIPVVVEFRPRFRNKIAGHITNTGKGFPIGHHPGLDHCLRHGPQGSANGR